MSSKLNLMLENCDVVFIAGLADAGVVQALAADENWHPLREQDGAAWAGLWLLDCSESRLGPFQLVQLVFFGSQSPIPPTPTRPLAIFREMALNPALEMIPHGTWTDSPQVQEYFSQQFGTGTKRIHGLFQKAEEFWRAGYSEEESSEVLLTGKLARSQQQAPRMTVEMARECGLGGWLKLLARKEQILNAGKYRMAIGSGQTITRYFTPADLLDIQQLDYEDLAFRPGLVQEMEGVRVLIQKAVTLTTTE